MEDQATRLIAANARVTHDIGVAEELAQDVCGSAAELKAFGVALSTSAGLSAKKGVTDGRNQDQAHGRKHR